MKGHSFGSTSNMGHRVNNMTRKAYIKLLQLALDLVSIPQNYTRCKLYYDANKTDWCDGQTAILKKGRQHFLLKP